MAYTYKYTGFGDPSTVQKKLSGAVVAEFPQDPGNDEYQTWLLFTAGGGSTTAADVPSIATVRAAAKVTLDGLAVAARNAIYLEAGLSDDRLGAALRFAEAQRFEDEGAASPADDADYPLLSAEIDVNGDDADEVHTAVLAELATLKAAMATTEEERLGLYADVDDAVDATAVAAVLAGVAFSDTL